MVKSVLGKGSLLSGSTNLLAPGTVPEGPLCQFNELRLIVEDEDFLAWGVEVRDVRTIDKLETADTIGLKGPHGESVLVCVDVDRCSGTCHEAIGVRAIDVARGGDGWSVKGPCPQLVDRVARPIPTVGPDRNACG